MFGAALRLLLFTLFVFKDEFLPKAGDLVKLGDSGAGGTESAPEGGLLLDEFGVLSLESLLLLDSLSVQDGKAELQVADLAIIALALLFEALVFGADGR